MALNTRKKTTKRIDLLLAWELGAGLGHVTRMLPLIDRAMAAGLSVKCLAIRHKDAAKLLPCAVEEAPWLRAPKRDKPPYIGHLADTLSALGWSDAAHLQEVAARWRSALEPDRPRVLVMDCAPAALLASQGMATKRVWLGDGWNQPPDTTPLPDMAERITGRPRNTPDTEPEVVASINTVLQENGEPSIARLCDLFTRVDQRPMLTLEELDPHGPRSAADYRGVWGMQPGPLPDWPKSALGADAPGAFAYLKPFPLRAAALRLLASSGLSTLVFASNATPSEREAIKGGAVRLLDEPVDWRGVTDRAAFVLCHGSPAMTGLSLQMGVPVVGIPSSLSQTAITRRATQTGAVIEAQMNDAESIRAAMHRVLTDESVSDAAQRFAKKYADHDPDHEADRLGDEIIALCRGA